MQGYRVHVIRSLLWQGGAQFLGQAVAWLSTLVVIRLLTPDDYGLVAMAMLFLGLFFMIADLGFGAATIQAESLDKGRLGQLLGMTLLVHLGSFAVTLIGAPFVAEFFLEPRLTAIIRVLSINFLLVAIATQPQSLLMRDLEFAKKASVDATATVTSALVAVTMALFGFGVWALVASILVQGAVKAVLFQIVRPVLLMPRFSTAGITPMVQFGLIITLDRILYFLSGQTDVAIAAKVLGTQGVGVYTVALALSALPMEKVLPVITQVAFAAFSRIQSDRERVNRYVLQAVRMVSLAAFPTFLGMAAVAADFVPLVLGDHWLAAIAPFQMICLILPLKALSGLFPPALFGVGRPMVNLVNMAIASTVMALGFLLGAPYGVLGLCLAWVVFYPVVFIVTTGRALSTLQISAKEFLAVVRIPALASVVMLGGVAGLGMLLSGAPSGLRLALMIATGGAIYSSLIWIWNRDSVRELWLVRSIGVPGEIGVG